MDPSSDPLPRQVLPAADGWSTYFDLYAPYAGLILLLLLLAGLVSASEAAFFSLSPDDRTRCRNSIQPGDQRIAMLLDRPKRLLASLVIFNNLLNIAIVVIVTYLTWEFSQAYHASGWILSGVTLTTTLAIVLFGEIVPKVYASQNNMTVARRTAPLAQVGLAVLRPLAMLLVNLSNQVDKRVERRGYKLSVEELSQAVELTGTDATTEEKEILKGIVNFSNLTARQVMRARLDISAVADDLTFSELMTQINASGYSRVPVYKESLDQIDGILYIKDLLPHIHEDDSFRWQSLVRPAFFIPENKKVDDLLQDFQKRRVHIAIVVDEYGGTRGLVTLEDIIEEIFGDINDEFDDETPVGYRREDDRTVVFEGKVPITDVCRILNVDATTFEAVQGDSESLGGLLLELFSRLPKPADQTTYAGYTFYVLSADDKRINEVRVTKDDPADDKA
ncbi:gliding motility-associated protein GldE [Spirosoma endbachense]|uniref:Gliding motility-associated protein GldE n=1 Tax=Spirosoma endbachense TaxID=2666025 RepID=A0A6P1VU61_9BACT|nr:gliding motility-associated protein GldE [Spirosoma endbachense]QHV95159.1 gliding motility-associated protein GldE [Spirosoma endbachense]